MSPTEAELRAFLHDGEGDVPDATSAISRALRVRYERRRRIHTAISSAAVVAVVATGLTFLFTRQSDENGGGSAGAAGGVAASAPEAHAGASAPLASKAAIPSPASTKHGGVVSGTGGGGVGSAGGAYRSDAHSAQAAVSSVSCPTSPTSYALPGGGGLTTYGAKQPMFARRPAGMKLCAYSLVSRLQPRSLVLSAAATRTMTRIIEKSSPLPGPSRMCPDRPADANRRIEIISADATGHRLRAVTITFQTCGPARVTNGTSVRYLYRLPAAVQKLVGPGLPAR
jgi:hypothetical protein